MAMPRFGFLKRYIFTGTGFAQPTRNTSIIKPDGVKMLERVQRKAVGSLCSIVPKAIGNIAVAQFMQGDADKRGMTPRRILRR